MFFSFPGLILATVWAGWLLIGHFAPFVCHPEGTCISPAPRRVPTAAVAAALLFLLTYAYGTHLRNRAWFDEETLWRDDVAKSPHNGRGLMIYGLTQMNKGDYPVALDYFTRALTFTPGYATLQINLGIVEGAIADQASPGSPTYTQGTARAEAHFQRAIFLAPDDDQPHAYYGRWLKDHGRPTEAIAQLRTSVALNPQRPMQRDELIEAYAAAGDLSSALQAAQAALEVAPDDTPRSSNPRPSARPDRRLLDQSLPRPVPARRLHRRHHLRPTRPPTRPQPPPRHTTTSPQPNAQLHLWNDAIAAAQRAIALKPTFQLARNNLAWAQAQKRLTHAR